MSGPTVKPSDLKLVAFDAEDLAVLAAHLQDAAVRVRGTRQLPSDHADIAI